MENPPKLCPNQLVWARVTGASILLMTLVGGLTYSAIHSVLHIPNDPLAARYNHVLKRLIIRHVSAVLLFCFHYTHNP